MALFSLDEIGRARRFSPAPDARRVGLVFSGGPAPGANAVIYAATVELLRRGYEPIGFLEGFKHVVQFDRARAADTMIQGRHWVKLDYNAVSPFRNRGGAVIRSARVNPAYVDAQHEVKRPADLADPAKSRNLDRCLDCFEHLKLKALITIGGDDTLKTSFWINSLGMPTVHVPKTIDNDYLGVDWTFGFFSAIEQAARDLRTLEQDAYTAGNFFLVEAMGRKAGWYAAGTAIAGGAQRCVTAEDLPDGCALDDIARIFVETMKAREAAGRPYGVFVMSEGVFFKLREEERPRVHVQVGFGHAELREAHLSDHVAAAIERIYKAETGRRVPVKAVPLGYTTRCVDPSAFDVLLSNQLGVGAVRFVDSGETGQMVGVDGQLQIIGSPYDQLMDTNTWLVANSFIRPGSDFEKLIRAMEFDMALLH